MTNAAKTIKTLGDILECAGDARGLVTGRMTGRTAIWFRGQPEDKNLTPKVYRKTKTQRGATEEYWKDDEISMAATFMGQAPSRYPNCPAEKDYARWLSLMQHYGLPTRLLDWTCSILVAAFFATEIMTKGKDREPDGVIWALNPLNLNEESLHVGAICSLTTHTVHRCEEFGWLPAYDQILAWLIFGAFVREIDIPEIAAVVPTEIDTRMTLQQSRFTIHGRADGGDGTSLTDEYGAVLDNYSGLLRKCVVDGSQKREIREALADIGIRQSTLFPSLDCLAYDLAGDFVYPKREQR